MEFLRNTNNNSWGVGFSEEGLLFGSTANGCPSVYLPIPNRYYESVRGWSSTVLQNIADSNHFYPITDKVRQVDFHGGFTAGAGHALYTARTYPQTYWNRTAFVAEPTGHLVATFTLQKDGSDFRSHNSWNLLASDDEWCAPIMAEVGPDGNMWVIDWYNYIVQHNPTPAGFKTGRGGAYETELRDKKHGRIYRLVCKKAPPSKPMSLAGASPATMVATLKNDNMFWRLHAQRLLVERGNTDVVPELCKLIEDKSVDAIGLNVGAIHALWTLQGLGVLKDNKEAVAAARKALKHPSAGVRRSAVLVQPPKIASAVAILEAELLTDEDAQVRLAALLTIPSVCTEEKGFGRLTVLDTGSHLAPLLDRPEIMEDRWLPDALTVAAADSSVYFIQALQKRKTDLPPRAKQIVTTVARHDAAGSDGKGLVVSLRNALSCRPAVAEAVLAGLAEGYKGGKADLDPDTERQFVKRLPNLSSAGKTSLLRLAAALGSKGIDGYTGELVKSLLTTLADGKAATADRIAAARQVVDLRPADNEALTQLLDNISPRTPPALTAGLLEAVGASKAPGLGTALVERLDSWTPAARTAAIRILLLRPAATKALLDAMEKGSVRLSDLALDQKQALAAHPDNAIAGRARKLLARGGDLPDPDRQKVVEKLTPLAKKTGDPVNGKAVFKAQCAKCHTHSGEGANIGPDLTGMAAHPKEELIIHIFDPSRSVEGNFRVYSVTTLDGKVFTGMLASETRTTLEIVDSEAKRFTIQRANVEALTGSNKSLMPEGFEKQLKEPEIVDLLEFLARPGRYLPLPLDKVATAVSTRGMFYSLDAQGERLYLVDPRNDKTPNIVLLRSPNGAVARTMPRSVSLPCNVSAKAIHFLSGVSGWGYPYAEKGSVTMIVRLHYKDGKTEDHELRNGEHFADYIRRVDVPGSTFAFALRGQQIRYLSITPKRTEPLTSIDLVKGPDRTAPVVMAVTVETR
jgi:putative heme-binding domain-containing protein